ncbi:hypothetical protein [Saccharopolyspora sp. CA-218241]|uniref:hypothetical protein n=1 Tax=Saccharopolyspora sp. CA-218241 TaxID=3240027 RepID=UPI003D956507
MALGRTKIGRRQRPDSAPADAAAVAEPDPELDSYLAALAPEEDVESTGSGRRFGASEVHQLRLPLMANERLKELAFKQGTSPAALARDWVLQHLSEADLREAPQPPSGGGPVWPGSDEPTAVAPHPAHGQAQHGQAQQGQVQAEPERPEPHPDPYGLDPHAADPYGYGPGQYDLDQYDPYAGDLYAPHAADVERTDEITVPHRRLRR